MDREKDCLKQLFFVYNVLVFPLDWSSSRTSPFIHSRFSHAKKNNRIIHSNNKSITFSLFRVAGSSFSTVFVLFILTHARIHRHSCSMCICLCVCLSFYRHSIEMANKNCISSIAIRRHIVI